MPWATMAVNSGASCVTRPGSWSRPRSSPVVGVARDRCSQRVEGNVGASIAVIIRWLMSSRLVVAELSHPGEDARELRDRNQLLKMSP